MEFTASYAAPSHGALLFGLQVSPPLTNDVNRRLVQILLPSGHTHDSWQVSFCWWQVSEVAP